MTYTDEYKRTADALGMTQRRISIALGVTQSTVNARLRGRSPVTYESLLAMRWLLAETLGGINHDLMECAVATEVEP